MSSDQVGGTAVAFLEGVEFDCCAFDGETVRGDDLGDQELGFGQKGLEFDLTALDAEIAFDFAGEVGACGRNEDQIVESGIKQKFRATVFQIAAFDTAKLPMFRM